MARRYPDGAVLYSWSDSPSALGLSVSMVSVASPDLFWGYDIDRTWLPEIIPHSNPPRNLSAIFKKRVRGGVEVGARGREGKRRAVEKGRNPQRPKRGGGGGTNA